MRANLTGAELNAAPLEGEHQENPAASVGLAPRHPETMSTIPRLPDRSR